MKLARIYFSTWREKGNNRMYRAGWVKPRLGSKLQRDRGNAIRKTVEHANHKLRERAKKEVMLKVIAREDRHSS